MKTEKRLESWQETRKRYFAPTAAEELFEIQEYRRRHLKRLETEALHQLETFSDLSPAYQRNIIRTIENWCGYIVDGKRSETLLSVVATMKEQKKA